MSMEDWMPVGNRKKQYMVKLCVSKSVLYSSSMFRTCINQSYSLPITLTFLSGEYRIVTLPPMQRQIGICWLE